MPHAPHRHHPPAAPAASNNSSDSKAPAHHGTAISSVILSAAADNESTAEVRHNASCVRQSQHISTPGDHHMPNRTRAPSGYPAATAHLAVTDSATPESRAAPPHLHTLRAQDPAVHQSVAHHSYYPQAVSYVQPPRDTVGSHFMHAPQQHWPAQSATSYPWHTQQQPQQRHQQLHHQRSLPHPAYNYQVAPGVSHVPMGVPQYSHVQPPVWALVHPHSNHSQYQPHVPVHMPDIPSSHYSQQYSPQPHMMHFPPHSTPQASVQRNGLASGSPKYAESAKTPREYRDMLTEAPRTASSSGAAKVYSNLSTDSVPQDADVQDNQNDQQQSNANRESSSAVARQSENGDHDSKSNEHPSRSSLEQEPEGYEKRVKQGASKKTSGNETTASSKPSNKQDVQQPIRKSRKPYTKTKNRENWTDKEHQLFLQALQLYNRDWKRIEQYIGTKTVLQIRSHAQKHFTKVAKFKTGEYIPPPRPKRRASRPYPRSKNTTSSTTRPAEDTAENASTRPPETNTVTSGSGIVSDSGAGSSDNGHVSGNGKSISHGSSDCGGNNAMDGLSCRRRSVDRTSTPFHNISDERDQVRNSNGGSTIAGRKGAENRPPRPSPLTGPQQQAGLPGGYDPYFCNVIRPDGLPYASGFYQNNYYSSLRPQPPPTLYPCYDRNCTQYNAYHSHTLTHGAAPLHAMSVPHGHESRGSAIRHHPISQTHNAPDRNLNSNRDHNMMGQVQAAGIFASDSVIQHDHVQRTESKNNCYPPLMVLSNCVDMIDRNQRTAPHAGWAEAAALRRAHRARIMRGRKAQAQRTEKSVGVRRSRDGEKHSSSANDRGNNLNRTLNLQTQGEDNRRSNGTADKPTALSSLVEPQSKSGPDILISHASSGANSTCIMDVVSDEAVAGFSGSDGQGSISDVAHNNGGPGRSETPDEDPNSSNDGSGDDRRGQNNTRGSSPTDPNSGGSSGSREDTPSARDTNDSQNEMPTGASRDTTPGDNGVSITAPSASNARVQNSSAKSSLDDTVMVAAKVLAKYSLRDTPGASLINSPCRKVVIDNLLNGTPGSNLYKRPKQTQGDRKRGRSTLEGRTPRNLVRSSCTGSYDCEPDPQRRKHATSRP